MSKKFKRKEEPSVNLKTGVTEEVKRNRKIIYLIFLVCFLFYGNTIPNNFSMDDELVTLNHPTVSKGFRAIPQIFTERYVSNEQQSYEYRPIVLVSFAIEHQFTGGNPHFSHFVNIALYALIGVVLFFLLSRLFINYHWILPTAVTFLFLIHPIHSEVVASLKNRDELLSFLFTLLSIRAFLNFTDSSDKKQIFYGLLFFGISFLSKRSSLPLLVTLPLILYYFKGMSLRKALSFIVFPILVMICYKLFNDFYFEKPNRPGLFYENPLYVNKSGLIEKLPLMFYCIGYYIKLLIIPYPLVAYYGYSTIPMAGWDNLYALVSMMVLIPVSIYALLKMKERKIWVFGFLYFMINAGAFSNIYPMPGIVAERFVFGASLGFFIMIGALFIPVLHLEKNKNTKIAFKPIYKYAALFLALTYGVYTFGRNREWKDHLTTYKADVVKMPESSKLHALIGGFCMQELEKNRSNPDKNILNPEQVQEYILLTRHHFQEALKIHPEYIACLNNIGTLYYSYLGNTDSAYLFFKKVIELDSTHLQAHFNLGSYYEIQFQDYSSFESFAKGNAPENLPQIPLTAKEKEKFDSFYNETKSILSEQKKLFVDATNIIQQFINANRKTGGSTIDPKNFIEAYNKNSWNAVLQSHQIDTSMSLKPGKEIFDYLLSNQAKDENEFTVHLNEIISKFFFNQFENPIQQKFKDKLGRTADSVDFGKMVIYSQNKKLEYRAKMINEFRIALLLKGVYAPAYTKLNAIYTNEGMWDSIITLNSRILARDDIYRRVDIYKLLGNAYLNKEDKTKALFYYEKAVKEEEHILNKIYLTSSHQAAAGNNIAVTGLNTLYINTKNGLFNAYSYMGKLYQELNNPSKANECFQQANRYSN